MRDALRLRALRQEGRVIADVKLPPLWRDKDVESITLVDGEWIARSKAGEEGWAARLQPPAAVGAVVGSITRRIGRRASLRPVIVTAVAAERRGKQWRWVIDTQAAP